MNVNWEDEMTTPMYAHLNIMTTPLEYKEQYPVKVEILGVGRTGRELGWK